MTPRELYRLEQEAELRFRRRLRQENNDRIEELRRILGDGR